ncbi:glutathione S-transferase family protein [Erythrobacter rubeus]|uniref:Glutathione S-transferase family protein n=1 Tax=Erythrobacter rubeus TaxID=2760803 RepID=A0ABR8KTX2_9SPHN|nr:glutathione S-transferase family protein [Erythrobacter rubeus]MBD2841691.1 glutathione S-transferase family protein [Erythrobacter rubeus]
MKPIKLYGYCTSPYVRKVGAFLMYKGLDFEFVGISPFEAASQLSKFGGTQVPVLEIGDDWKRDSTPIGHWLDELYPEKLLVPADDPERETILEMDRWVSDRFMPSIFRAAIDAPDNLAFRYRAWRLAALVSSGSPLPEQVRNDWPKVLKGAEFIQAMRPQMNMEVDADTNRMQLAGEIVTRLGEGPFFGGLDRPSIVDLSLFPQMVFGVMGGLEEEISAAALPPLKTWMQRMAGELPANPVLIPDSYVVKPLAEALA